MKFLPFPSLSLSLTTAVITLSFKIFSVYASVLCFTATTFAILPWGLECSVLVTCALCFLFFFFFLVVRYSYALCVSFSSYMMCLGDLI